MTFRGENSALDVFSVLLVEDHPVVRAGLAAFISAEPDLEVCGEAEDVPEALRQVEANPPSLVIVDMALKQGTGIELCKHLVSRYPSVRTLVCSAHEDAAYVERAFSAGAAGYVNKRLATTELIPAIRSVLAGRTYLSPEMSARLLNRRLGRNGEFAQLPLDSLSDREFEVFELLGRGLGSREVASQLGISPKTVDSHRENLKRKLSIPNQAQLVRQAMEWVFEDR